MTCRGVARATPGILILRAPLVVPINRPPVENAAVVVSGSSIARVGSWRHLSRLFTGPVTDLGDTVLLPGLVNAHCHLDYTAMAGKIPPMRHFTDWIKTITLIKGEWAEADYAGSWREGAAMLLRTGTTTVADIEIRPSLLPDAWDATPLRVFSFLEMTGVRSRRDPCAILDAALQKVRSLAGHRGVAGLSPHAPYSTTPALLRLTAAAAKERRLLVSTHVAESALEFEMFRRRRGPMYEWLKRNERDMEDCGQGTPVQHLERAGLLGPHLLAIHANYLGRGDARRLAARRVSVVHCPRSHTYFEHQRFPMDQLLRHGVNVCLGTDSLATVIKHRGRPLELNLFTEMRALAGKESSMDPPQLLRMATINGARALGMKGRLGQLSAGAAADLIAVPFAGPVREVYDGILNHPGNVSASMINGRWAIAPPRS